MHNPTDCPNTRLTRLLQPGTTALQMAMMPLLLVETSEITSENDLDLLLLDETDLGVPLVTTVVGENSPSELYTIAGEDLADEWVSRDEPIENPGSNLHVSGLAKSINRAYLEDLFSKHGKVSWFFVIAGARAHGL